ncbi:hypothetical protein [Halalkalibacterium halodurans]|uniref:hypothetical protein n=1 Tax=Halalkalibacterium halodurans TaxID=86665 RepID=UPI002AA9D163|nr:hypothetical protein [Halalkalibacterium halodurans]MDY7221511.1 hypothetical protein [Halalkalibacterium halodurans]MDY7240787.1 hypothetical protein [Halalkalibacterium halodurans]MED4164564.1 hypothetical protein [Halalkalibacterium halodurans]
MRKNSRVGEEMSVNRYILTMVIVISAFILVGCGKTGSMNVQLGGSVVETDDKIIVEGKTNLLPGSRVMGQVLVNEDEVFSDSTEIVDKKGKFQMELEHHQYGDAEVVVTFSFNQTMQDEEVIEHYGIGGENMEGPFVYVDEHWDADQVNKKAEVRSLLEANQDEQNHTFQEPSWEDKPADYGDHRVWIEIDEITNDGEFFYLKGRTNLLEGSHLTGYYADWWETDETRVNPDGSFDLKIKYQYSEEANFTIKFDPYSWQWESIRETYGHNGEKLVGNLVITGSSSQYIEKVIEYEQE